MALSNMLNEPRREITETVVGALFFVGVFSIPVGIDYYYIAPVIMGFDKDLGFAEALFIGFLVIGMTSAICALVLVVAHWVGEDVCDAFQRRGVHLRPRERWTAEPRVE